ncbi:MAG: hypothetical protein ABIJ49_14320, partial [Pseudomonadota bacterium]
MAATQRELEILLKLKDELSAGVKKAASELRGIETATKKVDKGTKSASSGFSTLAKAASAFVASAVVAKTVQMGIELAKVGAEAKQVGAAFEGLGGSIEKMRAGSQGMVADIELMKSFNSAAQLVSRDFAQRLPDAMQYLSKVSAATGQDMGFMIDSLVKGVGRLSPMILDNLGIQVSLTEANEAYAASLGRSADSLTKAEQQTAVMNMTLQKLRENTAGMPDVADTAATGFSQITAELANVKTAIGEMIASSLEASGALGRIVDALTAIRDFAESTNEARTSATGLREELSQLVGVGALTEEQMQKLAGIDYQSGAMSAQAYAEALKDLRAEIGAAGDELLAQQELQLEPPEVGDLKGRMKESAEAALEAWGEIQSVTEGSWDGIEQTVSAGGARVAAQMKVAAMKAAKEWADGMGSTIADGAMEMLDIQTEFRETMAEIDEEALEAAAEAETQFQISQIQAEQEYQTQRTALMQAGATEQLAALDAKHAEGQSLSQRDYSVQQQLQERALIIQKINQTQAHIDELTAQRQKIQESLALKLMESQAFQELTHDEQIAVLEKVDKGTANKLKIEHMAATKSVEIAAEMAKGNVAAAVKMAEGLVDAGIQTAEGRMAATDAWVSSEFAALEGLATGWNEYSTSAGPVDAMAAARAALAKWQSELKNWQMKLPTIVMPSFELGLGDIDAGVRDIGRNAQRATEPATRALSEVVKQIDDGVKNAKSAIKNLLSIELPEGLEEGFDRFGQFVKTAVNKVYGWLDEPAIEGSDTKIKKRLESIEKSLGPLAQLLQIATAKLDIKVAKELPDLGAWAEQVRTLFDTVFDLVSGIHAQYANVDEDEAESELQRVASIVGDISSLLSLTGQELDKIKPVSGAGFGEKVQEYVGQLGTVIEHIAIWLSGIPATLRTAVEEAAGMVEHVAKLASLLVKLNDFDPGGPDWADRFNLYLERAQQASGLIYNWMREIASRVDEALVAEAGNLAESVKKLTELLINLNDFEAGGPAWAVKINDYLEQAKAITGLLYDWMREIIDRGAAPLVEEAGALAEHVGKLIGLLADLDDYTVGEPGWADRIREYIGQAKFITGQLYLWMRDIVDRKLADSVKAAASVAEHVAKLTDLLVDLNNFNPGGPDWAYKIITYIERAKIATGRIYDWMQEILARGLEKSVAAAAEVAAEVKKLADLLTIDLTLEAPQYDWPRRVVAFIENLKSSMRQLIPAVNQLQTEFTRVVGEIERDLIGEAAETAGKLGELIGLFDLANLWGEMQVTRPAPSQIPDIAQQLILDLKNVTPILQDGLAEVRALWVTSEGDMFPIISEVTQGVAGVFAGLSDMVDSWAEMTTAQVNWQKVVGVMNQLKGAL